MMRKVFLFAVIVLAVRAETTTMLWEAPGVEFVGTREWTDALQNKVYFNEKEHIFCGTICSRRVAECINSPPTEEDAVEACKTLLGKVARAPNQAIYNYTAKVDLESENESDNDDKSADSSNPSGAKRADSVSELRAVVRITELAFNFEEKPYSHFLKLDLEDVDLVTVSAGKTVKRELMDEGVVCDSYFFFTQRLSGEITKVYYRAAPSAVNDDIDAKKLNSSRFACSSFDINLRKSIASAFHMAARQHKTYSLQEEDVAGVYHAQYERSHENGEHVFRKTKTYSDLASLDSKENQKSVGSDMEDKEGTHQVNKGDDGKGVKIVAKASSTQVVSSSGVLKKAEVHAEVKTEQTTNPSGDGVTKQAKVEAIGDSKLNLISTKRVKVEHEMPIAMHTTTKEMYNSVVEFYVSDPATEHHSLKGSAISPLEQELLDLQKQRVVPDHEVEALLQSLGTNEHHSDAYLTLDTHLQSDKTLAERIVARVESGAHGESTTRAACAVMGGCGSAEAQSALVRLLGHEPAAESALFGLLSLRSQATDGTVSALEKLALGSEADGHALSGSPESTLAFGAILRQASKEAHARGCAALSKRLAGAARAPYTSSSAHEATTFAYALGNGGCAAAVPQLRTLAQDDRAPQDVRRAAVYATRFVRSDEAAGVIHAALRDSDAAVRAAAAHAAVASGPHTLYTEHVIALASSDEERTVRDAAANFVVMHERVLPKSAATDAVLARIQAEERAHAASSTADAAAGDNDNEAQDSDAISDDSAGSAGNGLGDGAEESPMMSQLHHELSKRIKLGGGDVGASGYGLARYHASLNTEGLKFDASARAEANVHAWRWRVRVFKAYYYHRIARGATNAECKVYMEVIGITYYNRKGCDHGDVFNRLPVAQINQVAKLQGVVKAFASLAGGEFRNPKDVKSRIDVVKHALKVSGFGLAALLEESDDGADSSETLSSESSSTVSKVRQQLEKFISDLQREIDSLRERSLKGTSHVKAIKGKVEELKTRISDLQSSIATAKSSKDAILRDMKHRVAVERKRAEEVKSGKEAQARAKLGSIRSQLSALKEKVEEIDGKITVVQEKLKIAEAKARQSKGELADDDDQDAESSSDEVAKLREELNQLNTARKSASDKVTSATQEVKQLTDALDRVSTYRSELEKTANGIEARGKAKISALEKQTAEMQQQLSYNKGVLEQRQTDLKRLVSESTEKYIESAKKRVLEANRELAYVRSVLAELNALEKRVAQLTGGIGGLRAQLMKYCFPTSFHMGRRDVTLFRYSFTIIVVVVPVTFTFRGGATIDVSSRVELCPWSMRINGGLVPTVAAFLAGGAEATIAVAKAGIELRAHVLGTSWYPMVGYHGRSAKACFSMKREQRSLQAMLEGYVRYWGVKFCKRRITVSIPCCCRSGCRRCCRKIRIGGYKKKICTPCGCYVRCGRRRIGRTIHYPCGFEYKQPQRKRFWTWGTSPSTHWDIKDTCEGESSASQPIAQFAIFSRTEKNVLALGSSAAAIESQSAGKDDANALGSSTQSVAAIDDTEEASDEDDVEDSDNGTAAFGVDGQVLGGATAGSARAGSVHRIDGLGAAESKVSGAYGDRLDAVTSRLHELNRQLDSTLEDLRPVCSMNETAPSATCIAEYVATRTNVVGEKERVGKVLKTLCVLQYGECNRHGMCKKDGSCNCDLNFRGKTCDLRCPASSASHVCSGHGKCAEMNVKDTRKVSCFCRNDYRGNGCSKRCPGSNASGTKVCSGRASCSFDAKCYCPSEYRGEGCEKRCPGSTSSYVCNKNGYCNFDGRCICKDGWVGSACDRKPDGRSRETPAPSCAFLKAKKRGSGTYWVDPRGSNEPYQVYCNMNLRGKVCALAMKVSGSSRTFASTSAWTSSALVNTGSANMSRQDARLRSFVDYAHSIAYVVVGSQIERIGGKSGSLQGTFEALRDAGHLNVDGGRVSRVRGRNAFAYFFVCH